MSSQVRILLLASFKLEGNMDNSEIIKNIFCIKCNKKLTMESVFKIIDKLIKKFHERKKCSKCDQYDMYCDDCTKNIINSKILDKKIPKMPIYVDVCIDCY